MRRRKREENQTHLLITTELPTQLHSSKTNQKKWIKESEERQTTPPQIVSHLPSVGLQKITRAASGAFLIHRSIQTSNANCFHFLSVL